MNLNDCRFRRGVAAFLITAAFLIVPHISFGTIVIDGFDAAVNDRFTNDSANFVGGSFDFSGVGRGSSGGWGTLVGRNVVLTAAHTNPSSLTFFETNDPSSFSVTRSITRSTVVGLGQTDLRLSVLDSNVPEEFKVYDIAEEFLSGATNVYSSDAGNFQDLNAYMVGVSSVGPNPTRQAVGRNRITGYVENASFRSYSNADSLYLQNDSVNLFNGDRNFLRTPSDFVANEAVVRPGDSGAPLFVESDGDLLLLGANSFYVAFENTNEDVVGEGSGIAYVGNRSAEIAAFVTNNAVPEPGASSVLALLLLAGVTRRRQLR